MVSEKKVFYQSSDGKKICGIIAEPQKVKGWVLLAHGITMDKNEWNNFYVDITHQLYEKGFASLRFDFRAHGESEGAQEDMTIIGELLDIKASAQKIFERWDGEISLIGTSFGAGPVILYAIQNKKRVDCIVLLCPVLDYTATFLKPITPWAKETFNEEGFKHLKEKGYILLDGKFKLGIKLIEEFKVVKPYEILSEIEHPVLTIHGNKDTMVPFKISQKYGAPNKKSQFVPINGADHGFIAFGDDSGESKKSLENKKFVIEKIVKWIEKWG